MTADEARALLVVGALLFGAGNGTGFVGGRVSAPVPPEVLVAPAVEQPIKPVPYVEHSGSVHPPKSAAPAKPKAETKPKPKAQPKPPEVKKPRPVRAPTASECAQLRLGLATIGRDGVNNEANKRGYTKTQVAGALAACGL